jgi:hypothetical protein
MFRSTQKTVVFTRPFFLVGAGTEQPAGSYIVETYEELLGSVSFPAYRRVSTVLYLHETPGDSRITGVATIDPDELEAALLRDSLAV